MLPNSKHGDCSSCSNKDCSVRKVGKLLYCLQMCYPAMKRKEQVSKAAAKNKVRSLVNSDENKVLVESNAALQRWFKEKRKQMSGTCQNCGGKTSKDDDKYFKFCIAHILPKAYFKSVATHEDNWLELCHFGKSCHTNLDNLQIDLIDLNCFDAVIEKFTRIYPDIAPHEKRRIPNILIEYYKNETN